MKADPTLSLSFGAPTAKMSPTTAMEVPNATNESTSPCSGTTVLVSWAARLGTCQTAPVLSSPKYGSEA